MVGRKYYHYVPQFYVRRFSADSQNICTLLREILCVFEKCRFRLIYISS